MSDLPSKDGLDRQAQVLDLLRATGLALDDDDIGDRLDINRHYVNRLCRDLAAAGLVDRRKGSERKYVNSALGVRDVAGERNASPVPPDASSARRPRIGRSERARRNLDQLVDRFGQCVDAFERSNAFPGPSLYFHERALERRRQHHDVESLLADELFFEYVYAVLPAWGMHRMGPQAAKVGEFGAFIRSFRTLAPELEDLWSRRITEVGESDAAAVAEAVWKVIARLHVSTSGTRIVAGSKALHHVLPDLVPPIDRQYTFRFFTGQKAVSGGEERAFMEWFPLLCEVGRRCSAEIAAAVGRRGFMATGPAKVIDNAIMGFMQLQDGGDDAS
jgi:hypothetical protein